MSVHQISEFYIYIKVPKNKQATIFDFLLDKCADFHYDDDDLTVDGFNSEGEAVEFENQIKALL